MMLDPQRSVSRWSNVTRSTNHSYQTIPLVTVRRKLFRPSTHHQKFFQQRQNQTKHDMEELFRLYYSNDLQFDTLQRQIVTGKRISTPRTAPIPSESLNNSSNHFSDVKLNVSQEQILPTDMNSDESKSVPDPKLFHPRKKRVERRKTPTMENIDTTPRPNKPVVPPVSLPVDDLCEPSLVKSVTFLDETLTEFSEEMKSISKPFQLRRPTSSKSSTQSGTIDAPHPSLLMDRSTSELQPRVTIQKSATGMTSARLPTPSSVKPSSAFLNRQRSGTKLSSYNQRIKSGTTVSTDTTSKPLSISTRSPAIDSAMSFQSETHEESVTPIPKRVVSIPSRCSRYVLVSFPEVPLRYNAPTYVERLLLPERFPNLFQNIVRSYESRGSPRSERRSAKHS